MSSPLPAPVAVEYPDSDGKPLPDSDFQFSHLAYARERLRIYYRDECGREDVYVAGNLLIYYEEGNLEASVAPDVFVVVGVRNHDRRSYRVWEEGRVPDFVLEIASKSTWEDDQGKKRELYRGLGVTEYWQYDPTGEYLEPVLQGLELVAGEYVAIPSGETEARLPALASGVLGLELHVTDDGLRFHDAVTGKYLTSHAQAEARAEAEAARAEAQAARAEAAEARAAQEAEARANAEARVAELEARLRERGDPERSSG